MFSIQWQMNKPNLAPPNHSGGHSLQIQLKTSTPSYCLFEEAGAHIN